MKKSRKKCEIFCVFLIKIMSFLSQNGCLYLVAIAKNVYECDCFYSANL